MYPTGHVSDPTRSLHPSALVRWAKCTARAIAPWSGVERARSVDKPTVALTLGDAFMRLALLVRPQAPTVS